ncbi:N-acetylmuramidase family protein [Limoniibacter endophyticus]|uniref:N-acetylmuramidase domain-containing protein n=1 Tax=Limoniibacter endophyticus TaxID=1565040 RepID=A0A8J3DLH8_9HYPH|nr:N-acetylmuramidase family protein [Limoniibacter endophyticus]GHC64353.1 hypothetical protein GCM10010136_06250 [Limoniibacter endophyticus]
MLTQEEIAMVETLAAEYGYEAQTLRAIIDIESGGRTHVLVDGGKKPLIRFEGHWFDRLLAPEDRQVARAAFLSASRPGAIRNPREQKDRWRMLARACALNETAALSATSWGVGQVMGFHWKVLGFVSVQELRDQACENFEGQMRLMLRFLSFNDLDKVLLRRDWEGFARAYNGPAYRKNSYHLRLARAHERFAKRATGAPR